MYTLYCKTAMAVVLGDSKNYPFYQYVPLKSMYFSGSI